MSSAQETHLWSTKGGADKVYNLYLREKSGGWVVDYTNGKRGGTLATGTLTQSPLTYETALKKYNSQVKSKINGSSGYTTVEGGQAYTSSELAGRASGIEMQLLTSIDETTCEQLISNGGWAMQEKANGERRVLIVQNGAVTGTNRNGLLVNLPVEWQSEYEHLADVVFDGEHVGSTFRVFDLLSGRGTCLRHLPFEERYRRLTALLDSLEVMPPSLRLLEAQFTTEAKANLLRHVREMNLEGVVFKRLTARNGPGRSEDALKFKLTDSATCIVVSHNVQRSVVLGLLNDKGEVETKGNVTIPENHAMPAVNDLVEVSFLYYTGKAFEQGCYEGKRSDVSREDARIDQIKRVKPANREELALA